MRQVLLSCSGLEDEQDPGQDRAIVDTWQFAFRSGRLRAAYAECGRPYASKNSIALVMTNRFQWQPVFVSKIFRTVPPLIHERPRPE